MHKVVKQASNNKVAFSSYFGIRFEFRIIHLGFGMESVIPIHLFGSVPGMYIITIVDV